MKRHQDFDLYINDSSEEQIVQYNFSKIINKSVPPSFIVSHVFSEIGQSLLEQVKEQYKNKKLQVKEKISNQFKYKMEKGILTNYLKFKNSGQKQKKIEESLLTKGKSIFQNELIISEINQIQEEKKFYNKSLLNLKQKLFPLLAKQLLEFINNNTTYSSFWSFLGIKDSITSSELLLQMIELSKSFNPFINKTEAINNLINNINSKTLKELVNNKNKQQFVGEPNLQAKKFVQQNIQNYVSKAYNQKQVNDVYQFLQKHGQQIPNNNFFRFYKIFSDTEEITKARNKLIKNQDSQKEQLFLIKYSLEFINLQNEEINSQLIKHRPKYVFDKDFSSNLINFLLDHRILRSYIKEVAIKQQDRVITNNKQLPFDRTNEMIRIYTSGARADLRFLHSSDSYHEIVKQLESSKIESKSLKTYLIQILQGKAEFKNNKNISHKNKVYLYKFADLLFNLETERNVSAFLTNAMFFDLLDKGKYKIEDLLEKLPMAMNGAVNASRYNQNQLPLKKKHNFDFKDNNAYTNDVREFNLKNITLMLDWLDIKSSDIDLLIKFKMEIQKISFFLQSQKLKLTKEDQKRKKEEFCNRVRKIFDYYKQEQIFSQDRTYFGQFLITALDKLVEIEVGNILKRQNLEIIKQPIHKLVMQWYGINLSYLNNSIKGQKQR